MNDGILISRSYVIKVLSGVDNEWNCVFESNDPLKVKKHMDIHGRFMREFYKDVGVFKREIRDNEILCSIGK